MSGGCRKLARSDGLSSGDNCADHATDPVVDEWEASLESRSKLATRRDGSDSAGRGASGQCDETSATDLLLLSPAQFQATDARTGTLRRYRQIVVEVRYLEPNRASADQLVDDLAPVLNGARMALVGGQVALTVESFDDATAGPQLQLKASWTLDGRTWRESGLNYVEGRRFAATLAANRLPQQVVLVARDAAGNSGIVTLYGPASTGRVTYLPLIRR